MTSFNSFTLYYLNLRARTEALSMILSYGNISYANEVVSFADWGDTKKAREICPFGQLPAIKLPDGKVICESHALIRYAAKLAGVYPSDIVECAEADMLLECSEDLVVINPVFNFYPIDGPDFSNKKGMHPQSNLFKSSLLKLVYIGHSGILHKISGSPSLSCENTQRQAILRWLDSTFRRFCSIPCDRFGIGS